MFQTLVGVLRTRTTMPRSLEAMRGVIAEDVDYLLFDEVAKTLDAGAFRAAYVMTWIAVAESLRNKFVVMADRDAEVGRIVRTVEHAENKDEPTDRLILDAAAKLGLVSSDEARKLGHMREMRNVYAHPRQAGPSEEEVLAALATAVDSVLSRSPALRHGYVNGLLVSLFDDRHFLDDVEEIVSDYASGVARRVHLDATPYLVAELLKRLEPLMGDPEMGMLRRRCIWFSRAVLDELRPTLSAERWDVVRIMQRCPRASSALYSEPVIWPLLPPQAQDMAIGRLLEPADRSRPSATDIRRVRELQARGLLTSRQEERLDAVLGSVGVNVLAAAGMSLAEYAPRVVEELASHNWYRQNDACDALMSQGPKAAMQLNDDMLEELGRNVLQAAEGTAGSAMFFIEKEIEHAADWPEAFVRGLLAETLVNERGEFRLKGTQLRGVWSIVEAHPAKARIVTAVTALVSASKPRWPEAAGREYEEATEALNDVDSAPDELVWAIQERREEGEVDSAGHE